MPIALSNCSKKNIVQQLDLVSNGAIINGEIFIKARKLGHDRIKQVPVSHYPRQQGRQTGAKPRVLWEALVSILHLWASQRQN